MDLRGWQHRYETEILEAQLDSFGHVNHTEYFRLFEQARWNLLTERGFGLQDQLSRGVAVIVIEAKARYRKELRLHEKVSVKTGWRGAKKSFFYWNQQLLNERGETSCEGELTFAFFDLVARKMMALTPELAKLVDLQSRGQTGSSNFSTG